MKESKMNRCHRTTRLIALTLFAGVIIFLDAAKGQNLLNSGQIVNSGSVRLKNRIFGIPQVNDGIFEYFGASQTVPAATYRNLWLSGSGAKNTSGGDFVVVETLHIAPGVRFEIERGSKVFLQGGLKEEGYLAGMISASAELVDTRTASDFGNIGIAIGWVDVALDSTTVTRVSGVRQVGNGNLAVLRYYDVQPEVNSGLISSLAISYHPDELNGNDPSRLILWKSKDSGGTWTAYGGIVDTALRIVSRGGITSHGRWALSDSSHPLGILGPIESSFAILSGNGQNAVVGSALDPLVVSVQDGAGDAVYGSTISFEFLTVPDGASGQSLFIPSTTSDPNGQVRSTCILGTKAGTYRVRARLTDTTRNPLIFTLTALAAEAASISVSSGDLQSGSVNDSLELPLTVIVTDSLANPVSGVTVTFAIAGTPAGAVGQRITTTSIATNSEGKASTIFHAGDRPGTYTVTASAPGLAGSPVVFNESIFNPLPTITGITPMAKTAGDSGFVLTVTGTNFTTTSVVRLNGSDRSTSFVSKTQILASITALDIATGGVDTIVVYNPPLGGGVTAERYLTATAPLGQIISLSPASKRLGDAGFTLTIMGSQFVANSVALFDGSPRPTSMVSSTQLMVEITVDDLLSVASVPITVFTPSPGGGTSNVQIFSVIGASISGMIFNDRNADRVKNESEEGISRWTLTLSGGNPDNTRTAVSQPGGTFAFLNLPADTYVLNVQTDPRWRLTYPESGVHGFTIERGIDSSGIEFGAQAIAEDTLKFRSFVAEDFTVKRPVKKRIASVRSIFLLTNDTQERADGLHLEFSGSVDSLLVSGGGFEEILSIDDDTWQCESGSVEIGDSIFVTAFGSTKSMKISRRTWAAGGFPIETVRGSLPPQSQAFLYGMPNEANVREDVFKYGFTVSGDRARSGMTIGIAVPESPRSYGWVKLKRAGDLLKSLVDKSGMHSEDPKGFVSIDKGRKFVGQKSSLPPLKQNNRLFANLAALKMNIMASALSITPVGFGELVYDEGSSPLSGLLVKDIASHADSLLTFWRGKSSASYELADTTIAKINKAFSGPIDTLAFASGLVLSGVGYVDAVSFLRVNPNIKPVMLARAFNESEELPPTFRLSQNYPNPFNATTIIAFDLPAPSYVTLAFYNVLGQEVMRVLDGEEFDEGANEVEVQADDLASGVYIYRMIAKTVTEGEEGSITHSATGKMVLAK